MDKVVKGRKIMSPYDIKPGIFTGLADEYSKNRPDYCGSVLNGLLGLLNMSTTDIDFVDIGAGTGIWARMVCQKGVGSVVAVEPNEEMRANGIRDSRDLGIRWQEGTAEKTGLPDSCCNWVTMASAFHWTDFESATSEFYRILRPGGRFSALWNPRLIEANPVFVEIEAHLKTLNPDIERVSSGRSGMTETLTQRLWDSPYFEDVVYMEGRHVISMTPSRYLGIWRSVNDLRVQLGKKRFETFLGFVEERIKGLEVLDATYLTRAWSAGKAGESVSLS